MERACLWLSLAFLAGALLFVVLLEHETRARMDAWAGEVQRVEWATAELGAKVYRLVDHINEKEDLEKAAFTEVAEHLLKHQKELERLEGRVKLALKGQF